MMIIETLVGWVVAVVAAIAFLFLVFYVISFFDDTNGRRW